MKLCSRCKVTKPFSEFNRDAAHGDSRATWCRECMRVYLRGYRLAHPEQNREYSRVNRWRWLGYSAAHAERHREYQREYSLAHPEYAAAHKSLNAAVKDGRISREACEICTNVNSVHGHHANYSEPLKVRWLCASCHKRLHDEQRAAKSC